MSEKIRRRLEQADKRPEGRRLRFRLVVGRLLVLVLILVAELIAELVAELITVLVVVVLSISRAVGDSV